MAAPPPCKAVAIGFIDVHVESDSSLFISEQVVTQVIELVEEQRKTSTENGFEPSGWLFLAHEGSPNDSGHLSGSQKVAAINLVYNLVAQSGHPLCDIYVNFELDPTPIMNQIQLHTLVHIVISNTRDTTNIDRFAHGLETEQNISTTIIPVAPKQRASYPRYHFKEEQQYGQHYKSVLVGGTFDHLHAGHRLLLATSAMHVSPSQGLLRVGISSEELLKTKKYSTHLEPFVVRKARVQQYLETITLQAKTYSSGARSVNIDCIELTKPEGTLLTDPQIEALVASKETESNSLKILDQRVNERHLNPVALLIVDLVYMSRPSSTGSTSMESSSSPQDGKISSTWIRAGLKGN
eukprot:CAMPEP_0184699676 /NCGR_PEP_ID=MMETSP0313-20130426/5860_1 /TAXON_ID=2792 /ORGANISM="Porphyridium aerugineum, Strain SAG 1380-2" /LENGTH=351 /DNA_ID=CAMNT_0027158799 /DNA_START=100 /DNA_END=1155 /DNA_ORIENTATION=+